MLNINSTIIIYWNIDNKTMILDNVYYNCLTLANILTYFARLLGNEMYLVFKLGFGGDASLSSGQQQSTKTNTFFGLI